MAQIFQIDPAAGLRPEAYRDGEYQRPVSNRFKILVGAAITAAAVIVAADLWAPTANVDHATEAPAAGFETVASPDAPGCTPADIAVARYVGGNSLALLRVQCNPADFAADALAANR